MGLLAKNVLTKLQATITTACCNAYDDIVMYPFRRDAVTPRWYRTAAESGHGRGQNNLAAMYLGGRGVQQSDKEAAKWFTLAAEQGVKSAHNYLGNLYVDPTSLLASEVILTIVSNHVSDHEDDYSPVHRLYTYGLSEKRM